MMDFKYADKRDIKKFARMHKIIFIVKWKWLAVFQEKLLMRFGYKLLKRIVIDEINGITLGEIENRISIMGNLQDLNIKDKGSIHYFDNKVL